jgi:hypothetical protein
VALPQLPGTTGLADHWKLFQVALPHWPEAPTVPLVAWTSRLSPS